MGCLATACLAAFILPAGAPSPWDEYRAILWISELPADPGKADLLFRRLREMGCNAASCYPGMDAEAFRRNGVPFYVENLTRCLFIKGDRGWDAAWQGFHDTRDPAYFVRKPCLNDPAVREDDYRRIAEAVGRYGPYQPFAYDIRDEPSVTTSANPFDFCLCERCLSMFREWLQAEYGGLEALNAEWGTAHAAWDSVRPTTTDEAKARVRDGDWNLAAWADHRAFMDATFADVVGDFAARIVEADPHARAGLEGTQMPHAFGGYDFPSFLPKLDWIEPYDMGSSREIVRSLAPGTPCVSTLFESDENQITRRLWYLLLHGDRGAIVWWSPECIDLEAEDMPLTEKGRAYARPFGELTSDIGRTVIGARPVTDPVAIHYSQASIRADWMIETQQDGDTWIRRFSSYEANHNQQAAARNAMVKLVEDLGLQAKFVDSARIEAGVLEQEGYRVLLLPRSYALSDAEAQAIGRFVEAGGTAIADGVCGLFDEHCRLRPEGVLDGLFGVTGHALAFQGDPATEGAAPGGLPLLEPGLRATGGAPAVLADRRTGSGRAVYLNRDVTPYATLRLHPGTAAAAIRKLMAGFLPDDVRPWAQVIVAGTMEPAPACEVHRLQTPEDMLLAVMRNPQFQMSEELRAYGGNEALETPMAVEIRLPAPFAVRDARTGEERGITDRIEVTLSPWEPVIYRLQ